jgi:hypothetical protein
LVPKLIDAGLFLPIDRQAAAMLCWEWAVAERARLELRRAKPGDLATWQAILDQTRRSARRLAGKFLLIAEGRVPFARLDAEGRDVELTRIFDPAAPLRRARLTAGERHNLDAWNERARAVGLLPAAPTRARARVTTPTGGTR